MPNFDIKPKGISYTQWLREKNLSFRITDAIHVDSGIPLSIHDSLKNKPHELYDMALARQGKPLDPEDIGEE